MKKILFGGFLAAAIVAIAAGLFLRKTSKKPAIVINGLDRLPQKIKTDEEKALFSRERMLYEFNMLKDPVTGKLPINYREVEMSAARQLPVRTYERGGEPLLTTSESARNTTNNIYQPAGPDNIGGRTRAVAYDKRFNGTTNRVILAGSVSGGIFRSDDGGVTWARVSPEDDVHNVTTLAQDPRPGSEDIWYAAGGEAIGNSAEELGALYLGFGVWKSTDNGVTWTKLSQTIPGIGPSPNCNGDFLLECFDHPFDIVHKVIVNPANGHVYVASHRRLIRSTNGGASWSVVFDTFTATTADLGQMDVVCTNTGVLYLALNGGNPDGNLRGIWTSISGNTGSWTRLAGGNTLNTDSVAGWRGNDRSGNSRRIVLALAPSAQNILYVTYENGLDHSGANGKPEADLYQFNANTSTWTNRSDNVPDFPGGSSGIDPFHTQFGYNLTLVVHPDDPDVVFLGGVNLFRSTNGFTSKTATAWIGGYAKAMTNHVYGHTSNPIDITKWSHPDIHHLVFDPTNHNRAICANDGGMQVTQNIMAGSPSDAEPVAWTIIANYQTLQYYRVAIDPEPGRLNFVGGAQDNGTRYRDGSGFITNPGAGNDQLRLMGGDGGAAAIAQMNTTSNSQLVFCSSQYGNLQKVTLSTGNITFHPANLRPTNATAIPGVPGAYGEFVTNFELDPDNTEDLYYINFNRLFRTTSASTVTSTTWQEMTGVGNTVDPNGLSDNTILTIRAVELSRGPYFPSHVMYLGTTGGRVYRLNNPRNASPSGIPVDITPPALRDRGVIVDIASNPNNDEEIIVVASNYTANGNPITNIWWTNNAKSSSPTWRNAEGNLGAPSIRSCAIVVKKDGSNNPVTEYYVGTSVGLYSAADIGATLQGGGSVTWAREGSNVLNFAVVTSLAYRPQDNILVVGTHGNGMYYASVGTADFRPNQNTGIDEPTRNDDNFIREAFPTMVKGIMEYRIGNMFTVKGLVMQVHSVNGQQVLRKETGYQSGSLDLGKLSKGAYILTITSNDFEQQFVKKFVRE